MNEWKQMSLIGIDVGSSSIKVDAYRSNGEALANAREALTPRRPQPGWREIEPEEVWNGCPRFCPGAR